MRELRTFVCVVMHEMAVTKQKFVHPRRGLSVASGAVVFILLSVPSLAAKPRQCYWCGPLAEQVHRSQRAPSCDGLQDQVLTQTTCDAGLTHCATVATSPPYVESRYCVKLYQDECYSRYCNSTKTWKMTCPCKGDLCNGANTERETEAFRVLSKLVAKTQNNRIKRSSNIVSSASELDLGYNNNVGNVTNMIEEKIEQVDVIDNNVIETLSTMSVDSTPVEPMNLKSNNDTGDQNIHVEENIDVNENDEKEMQSDQPTAEHVNKVTDEQIITMSSSVTISEVSMVGTTNDIKSLNDNKVDQNPPSEITKMTSDEIKPATEPPMKTTESKNDKPMITVTPSEALPTAKALQHENTVTTIAKRTENTPTTMMISTPTQKTMTGVTSKPTKAGENGAIRISSQTPLLFLYIFHNFL